MNSKLTGFELEFMNMFTDIAPLWKDALTEQIKHSQLSRDNHFSAYCLLIDVDQNVTPINTKYSVPVEIIIGCADYAGGTRYQLDDKVLIINPDTLIVNDPDAFSVLFHFRGGFLYEMEVFNLAGNELNISRTKWLQRIFFTRIPDQLNMNRS